MATRKKKSGKVKSFANSSSVVSKRKKAYKKGVIDKDSNMSFNTDSKRKAKPTGKRISKDGNVYYENRLNRADQVRRKKPYLSEGGLIIY